jgi:Zn-dependent protease with chaperone function
MLTQAFTTTGVLPAAFLSLVLTTHAAPAQNAPDLAIRSFGTVPGAEMSKRVLALPFTVRDAAYREEAITQLPASIRRHRITEGKLLRRVEALIRPALELHRRADKVELFLYQDKFPQGMLFRECLLVLSDSLVEPLADAELVGVVAHEMAHAYFMDEMVAARKVQDGVAMRVVELKCDAVAMLTLKLLGCDPRRLIQGLQRITVMTKNKGYQSASRTHPQIAERESFAERFIKLLD